MNKKYAYKDFLPFPHAEGLKKTRDFYTQNLSLKSALVMTSMQTAAKEYNKKLARERYNMAGGIVKFLGEIFKNRPIDIEKISPIDIMVFLENHLEENDIGKVGAEIMVNEAVRLSEDLRGYQSLGRAQGLMDDFKLPVEAHRAMSLYQRISKISEAFSVFKTAPGIKDRFCRNVEIENLILNRHHKFFTLESKRTGEQVLLNEDVLLACKDMNRRHFNLMTACALYDRQGTYDIKIYPLISEFIRLGRKCLHEHRNGAYAVFKTFEPIALGFKSTMTDPEYSNDLYRSQLRTIIDKIGCIPEIVPFLVDVCSTNYDIGIQLAQLSKIFLHPCIDVDEGGRKHQEKVNEVVFPDYEVAQESVGAFVLLWCRSYFDKTGRWPNLLASNTLPEKIYKCYEANVWHDEELVSLDLKFWAQVHFKKTLDFTYSDEGIGCVRDSSLAPEWENIKSIINPVDYRMTHNKHLNYKRPIDLKSRKVTARFIQEEDLASDIILDFDEGRIQVGDLVIILRAKELENKDVGRYFAEQTYRMRIYQTLTEHNIAQGILAYFPHTTMTMSEMESKHINQEFSTFDHASSEWVGVSLDFSSWNTRFRHWLVEGIFSRFDELFGMKQLYVLTHLLFETSRFFINEPGHAPEFDAGGELVASSTAWYGQKGGCEGLRQKGWTVVSSCLISAYSLKKKYHTRLTGQGDNQVLQIQIPKPQRMKASFGCNTKSQFVWDFLNGLERYMNRANLTLNPDECFASSHLFVYGKKYFHDRVELPSSLKHCCTICGDTNQSLSSTFNMIATAFTGGQDAASRDWDCVVGFTLACFWTSYIMYANQHDTMRIVPMEAWRTIWTWSAATNGLPLIGFPSFRMRGIPDHLTENYSVWRFLYEHFASDRKYIARVAKPVFSEAKPILLMKDPTSVPWRQRPSAESVLSETLINNMNKNTKSKALRRYLDTTTASADELALELWQIEPLFPRLGGELHRLSAEGVVHAMRSSFSRSSSVVDLMRMDDEPTVIRGCYNTADIPTLLKEVDTSQVQSLVTDLMRPPQNIPLTFLELFVSTGCIYDCPCAIAKSVRTKGWGREVHGVTVSMPADAGVLRRVGGGQPGKWEIRLNSIVGTEQQGKIHNSRGVFPMYFGSRTAEKMTKPLNTVSTIDTTQAAAVRLINLTRWVTPQADTNLIDLMIRIASERLGEEIFPVDKIRDVFGGSFSHRLADCFTPHHGISNSISHASTFVSVVTTYLEAIKEMGEDRNLFLQHYILFLIDLVFYSHLPGSGVDPMYGVFAFDLEECVHCCVEKVDDFTFSLPTSSSVRRSLGPDPLSHFCRPVDGIPTTQSEVEECIAQYCSLSLVQALRVGARSQGMVGLSHAVRDLPSQGIVAGCNLSLAITRAAQSIPWGDINAFKQAGLTQMSSYYAILATSPGVIDALDAISSLVSNSMNMSYLMPGLNHLHCLSFTSSGTPRGIAIIIFRSILHVALKEKEKRFIHADAEVKISEYMCPEKYTHKITKVCGIANVIKAFRESRPRPPIPTIYTSQWGLLNLSYECMSQVPELQNGFHLNIRMTQAGRIFGRSSTAPVKMLECLYALRPEGFRGLEGGTIVSCCEGAGSCLRMLSKLYPRCPLVYNSLQSETEMLTNPFFYPREALTDANMFENIVGCDSRGYPGDITSSTEQTRILEAIRESKKPFFIMTSDAENVLNPGEVFSSLIRIVVSLIERPSFIIWKTFNCFSEYNQHVSQALRSLSYKVSGYKPITSETGNGEHYIIATNTGVFLDNILYVGTVFTNPDPVKHFKMLEDLAWRLRKNCSYGYLSTESLHRFCLTNTLSFKNQGMREMQGRRIVRESINTLRAAFRVSVYTYLGQLQVSTREHLGWIALKPLYLLYKLSRICEDKYLDRDGEWLPNTRDSVIAEAIVLSLDFKNVDVMYTRVHMLRYVDGNGHNKIRNIMYVGESTEPDGATVQDTSGALVKKAMLGAFWSILGVSFSEVIKAALALKDDVLTDKDHLLAADAGLFDFDSLM